jgi:hypothetical protein
MARRPLPKPVLVIAILSIVFSSLGLIGGLCGMASLGFLGSIKGPPGQPNVYAEMMQIPNYRTFVMMGGALGLIVSAIELAAGIGLLARQPWARTAAIVYAAVAIPQYIITQAVQIIYFNPSLRAIQAEMVRQQPGPKAPGTEGMLAAVNTITDVLTVGVGLLIVAYLGYMLFVMFQPETIAALDPNAPDEPRDELFPHG